MKKTLFLLASLSYMLQGSAQVVNGHRYRGFVDATFLTGNDGVFEKMNSTGGGISTSHGYQFNPYVFLGAGVAYHYYSLDNFDGKYSIPFFTNLRVNISTKRISPFFDAKIGYSAGDLKGLYASPTIGVRFGIKQNLGLNVSLGYTAQGFEYNETGYSGKFSYDTTENSYVHSLTLSLGLDF